MYTLITIVELPEFIRRSELILSGKEKDGLLFHLSSNPKDGDLIRGAGGIRKLRWASKGKGKSGGSRIIYYFHNEQIPLFLLTMFSKGEKVNLTKLERNELAELAKTLVSNYKR